MKVLFNLFKISDNLSEKKYWYQYSREYIQAEKYPTTAIFMPFIEGTVVRNSMLRRKHLIRSCLTFIQISQKISLITVVKEKFYNRKTIN